MLYVLCITYDIVDMIYNICYISYETHVLHCPSKVNGMTFWTLKQNIKLQNVVCIIIFIKTSLQNPIKINISNCINTNNNIFKHPYQGLCQL